MVLAGHVRNGMIIADDPVELPEGAVVRVEVPAAIQSFFCISGYFCDIAIAGLHNIARLLELHLHTLASGMLHPPDT